MSSAPEKFTAARGPYPVGLREVECVAAPLTRKQSEPSEDQDEAPRVLPTSIWYPAKAPDSARADTSVSSTQPPDLSLNLPLAPHLLGQPHHATLDLEPDDRPRPLIVFSHGNSGSRHQSTFLMTHLASWGYVVAAPDHVGNTFLDSAERTDPEEIRAAHRAARLRRPFDLLGVLEALAGPATSADDSPLLSEEPGLLPPIDRTRLAALGHSFGGWTALKLIGLDARLRALCCLAPATEPFVARTAFEPDELPLPPALPTLILAAQEDTLVDLETSIRPLHQKLGPQARLEILSGLDHFHFCDGIELLHKMHFNAPRSGQLRETLAYEAVRDEASTHALLTERLKLFFEEALPHRSGD